MSANETAIGKDVRTQMLSSDLIGERHLEVRPPLGVEKNLVIDPVGHGLLADAGMANVPESGRDAGLAAGDLNSTKKSNNVRFIHGHPKYTNRFVSATTPFVCHENKSACNVVSMATTIRKHAPKPPVTAPKPRSKKRQAQAGRDGKTLGDRLALAMAHETGRRGHDYRQADLLADVNRLAQATDEDPALTQQMLSAIMRNQVTRSSYTPFMAAACHVNPLWLSDGIGNMTS